MLCQSSHEGTPHVQGQEQWQELRWTDCEEIPQVQGQMRAQAKWYEVKMRIQNQTYCHQRLPGSCSDGWGHAQ